MFYHQAISESLQFVLNNPDHHLLVSIQIAESDRIFVTKIGHVYTGSSRSIKHQFSATLRRDILKQYLILKTDNLIQDEPDLGSSLAVQKQYLDTFLSFKEILNSTIVDWYRTRQIYFD